MHRSLQSVASAALFLSACVAGGLGSKDRAPPTVPQDVVASSPLPTRVNVTWTASTDDGSGVGGYQVLRDGALLATVPSPDLAFQDDGVVAATAYSYTVRAFDRASPANVSAASAPAGVTTLAAPDVTPPSVPGNVVASASSPTQVVVSWSASTDAGSGVAGYQVRRGGVLVGTVNAPAITFQDTTVVASTAYAYSVRAFDAAPAPNYSAYSAAANVTTPATPDLTPPSVPGNVVAGAPSPTQVVVSWSASTDAGTGVAGYQVRRGGVLVGTVNAPATSYQDAAVAAGTAYAYTVRAFDAAATPNFSADSAVANVTTPTPGPDSGLDARPSNSGALACLAPARPTQPGPARLVDAFPDLPGMSSAVAALQAPGDPTRWFVVEQAGRVRVFANDPSVSSFSDFVDIDPRVDSTGGEMGLLGMAFHPDWPATPEVFLSYTAGGPRRSIVSRFTANAGNLTLDPDSEQIVLTLDQPFENHNGGGIHFGPDGYLYIGFGDGGSGGDPQGNGQKLTTLLGKFLRIDVRGTGAGYTIPADNRYAGNPHCTATGGTLPCPEIFALGLRNPWRWSFDRETGDLWAGDVGQDDWEEIDLIEKDFNYGWNLREGTHCYQAGSCPLPGSVQAGAIVVDPELDYPHGAGGGSSTTGGYVYRGSAVTALAGLYVFGDFGSGTVWTHVPGAQGDRNVLLESGVGVAAFAEDQAGELYVVDYGGRLLRIAPGSGGNDTVPDTLAAACPSAVNPGAAGSVLVPYRLNAPFWSDGAVKDRWMALPDATSITVDPATGDWDFPKGTVLVKEFRVGGKRVETRLFMRHTDTPGTWAGYTYEWNDAETGATRVRGGKARVVGPQTWIYPSEQQCLQCHTAVAGRSLGLETAQQNGDLTYPATGRTANQLRTLHTVGLVNLADDPSTYPAYPDPLGAAGTLEARARAYLHSNCSQCHRPGGPTPVSLDLRFSTSLSGTNACDTTPQAGGLGLANARIIAPGAPARSVLVERMNRLDSHRMPPVASRMVDQAGLQLLTAWIQQLSTCN